MAVGDGHTAAWSSTTRRVFVFGDNSCGALGLGDFEDRDEPVQVESFTEAATYGIKVLRLAVGLQHSLALMSLEDGEETGQMVFGWGSNEFSQLAAIDGADEPSCFVSVPHHVLKGLDIPVASLACHANYSALVSQRGEVRAPQQVFTWGRGDCGRLGYNPPLKIQSVPAKVGLPHKVLHVALGLFHALALTSSGQVYSWGSGVSGQLGHDKVLNDVPRG